MESLTWNKTDTDAVYAYMQEQERPAYMDTVRSVTAENGVPYLRFPMLESESFIEHGFSTRKGGVSTGIYESMNLTFNLEDDPENVSENFRRMAAACIKYHSEVTGVQPDVFPWCAYERSTAGA